MNMRIVSSFEAPFPFVVAVTVVGGSYACAVDCSKRGCSVAGDPPTANALCSIAGLAGPELTVLLHFGQRTLNGRCGDFSSSICKRVEHFWQTMIMNLFNQAQHGTGIGKRI